MEINPNRNVDPPSPAGSSLKLRAPARGSNEISFEQSASLEAALEAVPDSRADMVSRAEDLVSSSEYPPREMINRIANLLAANLLVQE
jgi:hypothetical protein